MYARGILFGTMKYELGDHAYVRCPETGLSADIEFKTKGYFSGTYDAIGGYIKDQQGNLLYEFSGLWNDKMYIKDLTVSREHLIRYLCRRLMHLRRLERRNFCSMQVTPNILHRQLDHLKSRKRESQRLWHEVTEAVKRRDQDVATDAKARIEDRQREEAAKRNNEGIDWHPQLFRRVQGGHGGSEEGEEDLDWIINAKV